MRFEHLGPGELIQSPRPFLLLEDKLADSNPRRDTDMHSPVLCHFKTYVAKFMSEPEIIQERLDVFQNISPENLQ